QAFRPDSSKGRQAGKPDLRGEEFPMRIRQAVLIGILAAAAGQATLTADGPAARSPKEALQPFNDLIGSWKGTGEPPRAPGKQPEFWLETVSWEWQFKGPARPRQVGFH